MEVWELKLYFYHPPEDKKKRKTGIFMRCCIARDPQCWKSVVPQSTQSELDIPGIVDDNNVLTDPTKELRRQEGES